MFFGVSFTLYSVFGERNYIRQKNINFHSFKGCKKYAFVSITKEKSAWKALKTAPIS